MKVWRHVYQSSKGGRTYCPLDSSARVMSQATPKFGHQVSSKYGRMASYQVEEDLGDNHGRPISRNRIQHIAQCVGELIERKEEEWPRHRGLKSKVFRYRPTPDLRKW